MARVLIIEGINIVAYDCNWYTENLLGKHDLRKTTTSNLYDGIEVMRVNFRYGEEPKAVEMVKSEVRGGTYSAIIISDLSEGWESALFRYIPSKPLS